MEVQEYNSDYSDTWDLDKDNDFVLSLENVDIVLTKEDLESMLYLINNK